MRLEFARVAQRYRRLSSLARKLSLAANRQLVGRTLPVLVEGPSTESELLWEGRTAGQGPEGTFLRTSSGT